MKIHGNFIGGNIAIKEQAETYGCNYGFACIMADRPECEIAFTSENAYFGTYKNRGSAERLIELGRCFAKSIERYIKER